MTTRSSKRVAATNNTSSNNRTKQAKIEKPAYDPKTEVVTQDEKAVIGKKRAEDHCCSICHEIYWKQPVCHASCGTVFCGICLNACNTPSSSGDMDGKCPNCRGKLQGKVFDIPIITRTFLDKLVVRCLACQESVTKDQFLPHLNHRCLQKCKNNCDPSTSCTVYRGTIELEQHYRL